MNRKDFLKGIGLVGMTAVLPAEAAEKIQKARAKQRGFMPPNCALIPTETAGPFPLDLTENTVFFRQDVRENKTGVQLNLKLKIFGLANCETMPNVRVNIWHCDKDGLYSGYSQPNNQGQAGLTYLRGYQMTDAYGEVNFVTVFPGWYNGRVCHIHFQVYVSSVYAAISQLTFPVAEKNALYTANAALYTKGVDPLSPNQDNIFSDGYTFQLATLTPNASGGYDSYLEVTINGSGTTGLGSLEPETGGQFTLGQNFPNPYVGETTIPFTLNNASDVLIDLWDLQGKKIASLPQGRLSSGQYKVPVDLKSLGLPDGNYAYQLQVTNENGVFRQSKMMTKQK